MNCDDPQGCYWEREHVMNAPAFMGGGTMVFKKVSGLCNRLGYCWSRKINEAFEDEYALDN